MIIIIIIIIVDEASVMHLIRLGASVTNGDARGLTALHWTAASPEAELLVPVLLARGSNIDARDSLGRTPLHFHSSQGRGFGVACLLHRGKKLYYI
jgi:ankyrin repeat protein